jgi:hypothetical protein
VEEWNAVDAETQAVYLADLRIREEDEQRERRR